MACSTSRSHSIWISPRPPSRRISRPFCANWACRPAPRRSLRHAVWKSTGAPMHAAARVCSRRVDAATARTQKNARVNPGRFSLQPACGCWSVPAGHAVSGRQLLLLVFDVQFNTTVLGTTFLGFIGRDRTCFTVAPNRGDAVGFHILVDQVALDRVGPTLGKLLVVSLAADGVGVAGDAELDVRAGIKRIHDVVQTVLCPCGELGRIELEGDTLQHDRLFLLDRAADALDFVRLRCGRAPVPGIDHAVAVTVDGAGVHRLGFGGAGLCPEGYLEADRYDVVVEVVVAAGGIIDLASAVAVFGPQLDAVIVEWNHVAGTDIIEARVLATDIGAAGDAAEVVIAEAVAGNRIDRQDIARREAQGADTISGDLGFGNGSVVAAVHIHVVVEEAVQLHGEIVAEVFAEAELAATISARFELMVLREIV